MGFQSRDGAYFFIVLNSPYRKKQDCQANEHHFPYVPVIEEGAES